jgi:hypothetical protein
LILNFKFKRYEEALEINRNSLGEDNIEFSNTLGNIALNLKLQK